MTTRKRTTSKARGKSDNEVLSKARLADEITKVIAEKGLTQTAAAGVAREAQSQMSLVMSGHLQGFSANRLIRILLRLGRNVDITVTRTASARAAGRVKITGVGPAAAKPAPRRR